jgi:hypothetical protein
VASRLHTPFIRPSAWRGPRRRVLIVNAFFDEYRRTGGSPFRIPRAMGPAYLAGAFSHELCDVRLYNEQYSGPLRDTRLLGWPDMLVLTGLTSAFDRMLHLTAYARTLNEKVVIVAGGSAVRALPRLSRRFFDYACTGDIEQLQLILRDAFGPEYVAEEMFPRFDLGYGKGPIGYIESSRNCNFRCNFCSLTAEKATYQKYDLDYVRRQILEVRKPYLIFIDNNFYGNDRGFYLARIDLLKEMYRAGRFKGWSALVTGDFFRRPENLDLMREAGGFALFSGVESLDAETLRSYNKRQNTVVPQMEMIRGCLEAGILFTYGIMLDPTTRRLTELKREIEFMIEMSEITLPAYFTLAIPLLGTPYFRECLDKGLFLPNTRLRDLDGVTLTLRPLDPIEQVLPFIKGLPNLQGYRARAFRHAVKFLARYRRTLNPMQLFTATMCAALICMESFATSPGVPWRRGPRQTYFGPTETLDPLYRPMMRVAASYETYFRPTMITNRAGVLAEDVAEDLRAPVPERPTSAPPADRPARL